MHRSIDWAVSTGVLELLCLPVVAQETGHDHRQTVLSSLENCKNAEVLTKVGKRLDSDLCLDSHLVRQG